MSSYMEGNEKASDKVLLLKDVYDVLAPWKSVPARHRPTWS